MSVWLSWTGSTRRHLAVGGVTAGDVRNGSFPLVCGRWAPDGWDTELSVDNGGISPYRPPCVRCQRIANLQQRNVEEMPAVRAEAIAKLDAQIANIDYLLGESARTDRAASYAHGGSFHDGWNCDECNAEKDARLA